MEILDRRKKEPFWVHHIVVWVYTLLLAPLAYESILETPLAPHTLCFRKLVPLSHCDPKEIECGAEKQGQV